MTNRKYLYVIFLPGFLLANPALADEQPTLTTERMQIHIDLDRHSIEQTGFESIAVGSEWHFPGSRQLIELLPGERIEDISVVSSSVEQLADFTVDGIFAEQVTSEAGRYRDVKNMLSESILQGEPIFVIAEWTDGNSRYADILFTPVTANTEGQLLLHTQVNIYAGRRKIASAELLSPALVTSSLADFTRGRVGTSAASASAAYVIITSDSLASSFELLARYRTELGILTTIKTVSEISATYNGLDDAEKLREYLKEFHALGGQYVLIGGDETQTPIRYAYHQSATTPPPLEYQQICDLYFADLTGVWDADGDGIYGERYGDAADLVPELLVGRLPVSTPQEVSAYTQALITYETDPGNGDRSYLTRSFYYSSDQMRDYSNGGQHGRIHAAYPSRFTPDTTTAVESLRGDDPAPTNVAAINLPEPMSQGFGIVNIIAHGRPDGFVVRSSGYNNWPKSLLLESEPLASHGTFTNTFAQGKPSFYYSLACDGGGFDFDSPPIKISGRTMVQELMSNANGAVGYVAYSRWGWVGSSYYLQKTFFDSLFAHPELPASAAMYSTKLVYSYRRDEVLGQNYYGDPIVRIYTNIPQSLGISSEPGSNGLSVLIYDKDGPVSGAQLVLSHDGELLTVQNTDDNGRVLITYELEAMTEYTVTVSKTGYTVSQARLQQSIATSLDDGDELLPGGFALDQNYPNPFNPETSIAFELGERSNVSLTIYNLLGQRVKLIEQGGLAAGKYTRSWNASDEFGNTVASGIYFYRLTAGDFTQVKKMVLLR